MSLLIKDVQVVDGKGNEPFKADVLVQKNIISAIGNLKSKRTEKVIDGFGHYLTPGFIDVDTESDHYLSLFTNPSQKDFVSQGVTTIFGGHCGSSLAPLLYGTLESISEWADPDSVNVDWHTTSEFLDALEKIHLGINFGTVVGHETIRRALIGESGRRLTDQELRIFKGILGQALEEGAFGLSTGLGYVHGKNTSARELEELVSVLKDFDGVYTTHLRNETSKLLKSVDETIKIAEKTGVKTLISHLQPFRGFEKEFGEALDKIEDSRVPVYFDVYPYNTSLRAVYTLLPEWVQEKNFETMLERVKNKESRKLIKRDWKDLNADTIRVASAPNHEYLIGKTLKDLADGGEEDEKDALLRLMETTGLKATVFNRSINGRSLVKALRNRRSFIGSSGNAVPEGESIKHERSTESFTKYLEMVLDKRRLSLPSAIQKITSGPAKFFGLAKRGEIEEGNIADLVVLGKNDYEIKHVVLGGRIVSEEENVQGSILRRGE